MCHHDIFFFKPGVRGSIPVRATKAIENGATWMDFSFLDLCPCYDPCVCRE